MVARTKSHGFSEQKYVLDRMEKRGMLGAKPMKPLMDPTVKLFILYHLEKRGMLGVNPNETSDGSYCKLFLHKEQLYDYTRRYGQLVGELLTITKPDISYAVNCA